MTKAVNGKIRKLNGKIALRCRVVLMQEARLEISDRWWSISLTTGSDMIFRTAPSSRYTDRTFKSLINQPIILPTGLCQRNTYYFNNATANPVFRNGNVTLGPGASGSSPFSSGLQKASPDGSGFYGNVDGYSACAQNVGYNPENCEQAARSVDPVALQ